MSYNKPYYSSDRSFYPAAFGKSRHRAWTGEQYPGPEKNKDHKEHPALKFKMEISAR